MSKTWYKKELFHILKLKQWCKDNWYYLKNEIDFKWWRYWDWNVSVTELLKLIWDPKFDFVMFKYKNKVDEAAKIWTQVHSDADHFFNAKSGITKMNKNFMIFHTLYNVEVIKREETLYKDWVRWTIDLIGKINYDWVNGIFNIDYKNSDTHSPKYLLQLAWYKWLNWNNWILVYWKTKLRVVHYNWELDDIWLELKDYFFKLNKN